MDVYLLGPDFERLEILESFETLVWTERYQAHGDFRMDVRETQWIRNNPKWLRFIQTSESNKVMCIERIERDEQRNGKDMLQIRGKEITNFLKLRNSKNGALRDAEVVSGSGSAIMRYMVHKYCVSASTAGSVNVFPKLTAFDPGYGAWLRLPLERTDLYSIVQSVAFVSGLGFTMMLDADTKTVTFSATRGLDRTAAGAMYQEYSVDGESLVNPSTFESIEGWKNHARVLGKKTGVDVYAPGFDGTVSGWNRRTLLVEANDVGTAADYKPDANDPPPTTIAEDQADLRERGKAALREQANRYQSLISGEIPTENWNATFFGLGDIVWVQDNEGIRNKMRISEQILSIDKQGERRTPTFEEYYTE